MLSYYECSPLSCGLCVGLFRPFGFGFGSPASAGYDKQIKSIGGRFTFGSFPLRHTPHRFYVCCLPMHTAHLSVNFVRAMYAHICKQMHVYMYNCKCVYIYIYISGYSRYYLCRFLCECCLAQSPTPKADKRFSCYDFTFGANWLLTVLSSQQVQDTENHPLPLAMLDGWNLEMYFRDIMHTLSLGIGRDTVSSAIMTLLFLNLLWPTLPEDEQLDRLHCELDNWCIHNSLKKVSSPRLSLRTLGRKDSNLVFPELSSVWKAAPINILISFLANFTAKVCTSGGFAKLTAVHCWALADFMWVLKDADIELDEYQHKRALHAGRVYLVSLQALCGFAKSNGLFLWRCRPKGHYFDHLLHSLRGSRLNPDLFSCMRKESMLGKLKKIGKSCARQTVCRVALEKHLRYLTCRIRLRRRTGKWVINPLMRKGPWEKSLRDRLQAYKASLQSDLV